ncbi:MAG: homoserine kinase [Firmicutes bacterium]|nr:homoserine kinase [Bacillota bacterium]
MIKVRVPATSANMGAGFDSLGIALGLYNTLKISETEKGLTVYNNSSDFIPTGENNLVYKSMCRLFDEVGYQKKGIKIVQNSEIPITRGLGSSSACVIGGLLAANAISGRQLSYKEILDIAVSIEGHPDNVTPALFGGFCVSATENGHTVFLSSKIEPNLRFVIMVPNFYVSTKNSRGILPEMVTLKDASYNISRAALLTSLLISGKYEDLRFAVEDRLHQKYRKNNIDNFDEIFEKSYEYGAKATYLSGSGPTIVSVTDSDGSSFYRKMCQYLDGLGADWKCRMLTIDNVGAILKEF